MVVTFVVSPDGLLSSVRQTGLDVKWYVQHHGSSLNFANKIREKFDFPETRITFHMVNRGLAASWNEGIHEALIGGADLIAVINDDIVFMEDGFAKFINFAKDNEDGDLFFALGSEDEHGEEIIRSQDFACYLARPSLLEKIGYFDENFFPAYFEDTDYFLRAQRAGVNIKILDEVVMRHSRSSSIKNPRFREILGGCFAKNKEYFYRKWGGDPASLATPFGENFGLKIEYSDRRLPYGLSFNRGDLSLLDILDDGAVVDVVENTRRPIEGGLRSPAMKIESARDSFIEVGELILEGSPGQEFLLDVEIFNGSGSIWYSTPAYPINVSYHIFREDGSVFDYEGRRTALSTGFIPTNAITPSTVSLVSPSDPGVYRFHITLVQEGSSWLEDIGLKMTELIVRVI